MHINLNYLYEKGYTPMEFIILVMISQKDTMYLESLGDDLIKFEEAGFITYVGKGCGYENVRISKKGREFIYQCTIYGVSDDVSRLATTLQSMYLDNNIEETRTGKLRNIIDRIVWFISESPFSLSDIYEGVEDYLQKTDSKYVMSLDNLFWKAPNVYAVNPALKDSKLFDHLCEFKGFSTNTFIEPTKDAKKYITWANGIVNNIVPKGLSDDAYFTGSYKGDVMAKKRIQQTIKDLLK